MKSVCKLVVGRAWSSEAQLHALLDVLAACTTRGHQIRIRVGQGYVVRQGELLAWAEQA